MLDRNVYYLMLITHSSLKFNTSTDPLGLIATVTSIIFVFFTPFLIDLGFLNDYLSPRDFCRKN